MTQHEPFLVRFFLWLARFYPEALRRPEVLEESIQVVRDAEGDLRGRPLRRCFFFVALLADVVVCRRATYQVQVERRPTNRLDDLRLDVRYGLRSLRRSPSFVCVSVLVLALGVGANATIFTAVDRLFLEAPPHIDQPERLVRINRATENSPYGALAYPDFVYYREHNRTFVSVFAYDPDGFAVTLGSGDDRHAARGWFVTDNYFAVLGTPMALGRSFLPEENQTPGTHSVTVISYGLWQRVYARDENVLGESVVLNGHPFTIVGVAPEGFRGASPLETPPDLWVPIMTQPLLAPLDDLLALERVPGMTWVWLYAVGRLAPGVTIEQARADVQAMARQLEETYPEWNEGWGATVTRHYRFHPPDRSGLLQVTELLLAVVVLLLTIACANVAILLLARGSSRQRETGLRLALGAGRGRILRQMITENLLLAVLGGAAGFALAWLGARLLVPFMPTTLAVELSPRPNVLLFALVLASVVALVAGLLPGLQAVRRDANVSIRGGASSVGGSWARSSLVVVQVALSFVLVAGSVLFARSLVSARSVDLGFELDHRLLVGLNLRNHGYDSERGQRFAAQALERLQALPGVVAASTTQMVPFRGKAVSSVKPEGLEVEEGEEPGSGFNVVSPGYFEALGIPLADGRGFESTDSSTSQRVVVVNQAFAERFWPSERAIGKTVVYDDDGEAATVVGVAANATYYDLGEEETLQIYLPLQQFYNPRLTFVVKTLGPPDAQAAAASASLLDLDPDVAVSQVQTLAEAFDNEIGKYRAAASLVGLFGLLALVLATVGLYGVLSFLVVQRTREIGIRVALGASHARVARLVVGRGLRLAGLGVVIGLAVALVCVRSVTTFLFGVEALDVGTWLGVPIVLLMVACLASLIPARRASRVDPVAAIRSE